MTKMHNRKMPQTENNFTRNMDLKKLQMFNEPMEYRTL